MNDLPKIRSEKEIIEAHMNICTDLFNNINERNFHDFHEVEVDLMEKGYKDKVEEMIRALDKSKNAGMDKLRLILLCVLVAKVKRPELEIWMNILTQNHPEVSADFIFNIWDERNEESKDDQSKGFLRGFASSLVSGVANIIASADKNAVIS